MEAGGPSRWPEEDNDPAIRTSYTRDSKDLEEPDQSSPLNLVRRRDKGKSRMAQEGEQPTPERDASTMAGDTKRNWSLEDHKREEYWRGYYDRKRKEREREGDIASEYRPRSQRFIEYPEDSPRGVKRSPSTRVSSAPISIGGQITYRKPRPLSYTEEARTVRAASYTEDSPRVSKRPDVEFDDEHLEEIYMNGGGAGGGSGRPRRRDSYDSSALRIPFTTWMNVTLKGHIVAAIGEFVGTTMFLFFAFAGTQVANVGGQNSQNTTTGESTGFSPAVLLYISLVFGFSLMVNVWIFFRISGGLFNPAVTLAMAMTRAIGPFRAVLLVIMQIAGSIFSSFIVSVLFPTEFKVRTTLSPGTSLARGVFIEAILTFELVFTIFLLAKEKHKATFIAPVGIGLALFIDHLVGIYYTGASVNPARSFGPCVVTGIFDKEHWIYWVGPGVGALAAVVFYRFIKILEYEIANPGQEAASEMEAAKSAEDVEKRASKAEIMV